MPFSPPKCPAPTAKNVDFWFIFSGVLLFFGLLSLYIRFFHWLRFKKDLKTIKIDKMKTILDLA
jgi:hypothetical protein